VVSFAAHDHAERNHQSLDNRRIDPGQEVGLTAGEVEWREPVSALVPIEDYESLLETMDILADKKIMKDLTAALAGERRGRLFKRDKSGRWLKYKRTKRVA
jgi:hypothetical protein